MTLHFASGASLDPSTNASAIADGYNLADVQDVSEVNALSSNTKALMWLNESGGVTQSFIDKVTPLLGNSKVFGFYLTDEPDPTGQYGPKVNAANLMAESDWIHAHFPGAKTFITTMNMGSSADPSYTNTYNYANTHIDLFGVSAYPVWSDTKSAPDYAMIDRNVQAAEASGIDASRIVPEIQSFGGGSWVTENGTPYAVPTASQEQAMLNEWAKVDPNPVFDYTYAWASQQGDTALGQSTGLQAVFAAHSGAGGTTTTAGSTTTTGSTTSTPGATGTTTQTGTGTSGSTAATGSGTTTTGTTTASGSTGQTSGTSGQTQTGTTTGSGGASTGTGSGTTTTGTTTTTGSSGQTSSGTGQTSGTHTHHWAHTGFVGSGQTASGTSALSALPTGSTAGTTAVPTPTAAGDHAFGFAESGGSALTHHWAG